MAENRSIDEQTFQEINVFLTAKRLLVILILAEKGSLSQGELAAAIESTVTSLSNIIQKFSQFKYPLLEIERVGRFRRYKLSALGEAYIEARKKREARESAGRTVDEEERRLLQAARESLENFKAHNADDWETHFDDALLRRTRANGEFLSEASEAAVDQYLQCLELLTMRGSYEMHDEALDLLKNPVHRFRVAVFMDWFAPFISVLQSIQNGAEPYDICTILKAAFEEQPKSVVNNHIKAVGWKNDEYEKLTQVVPHLKRCVTGYTLKQIYQYFTGLLPDQKFLCNDIAQWLYRP